MSISSVGGKLEQLFFSSKKRFLGTLAGLVLLLSIPVTMSLVFQQQDIRQRASDAALPDNLWNALNHQAQNTASPDEIDLINYYKANPPVGTVGYDANHPGANTLGADIPPQDKGLSVPLDQLPVPITPNPDAPKFEAITAPTPTINCSPGTSYCQNIGSPPGTNCTSWPYANCQACLPLQIETCTPAGATATPVPPTPTATATPTDACAPTQTTYCRSNALNGACTAYLHADCARCLMGAISCTPGATATPTTGATGAPTATPTLANISLSLSVLFPGIGSNAALGENTNPVRTPSFTVQVGTTPFTASLAFTSGPFIGNANTPNIALGSYTVKIKSDNSLYKAIPGGARQITTGNNAMPQITLVTGNINDTGTSQNKIDVQDYNDLISCYGSVACTPALKQLADLNDDGVVDSKDVNILLRAFATPNGD